ncbi:hypothetical protein SK571_10535 [Lentzea sp. BCCO 10_0798]|uniref:Uncharacterized protein n=1 Tax=Lentzea kristufekii TaxID=3095430 RepID=A0ABU4TNL8_9PSEU|nr:hypothetical protein [Lentzea sp. BCCO 10_0798]MDX8049817.1 hypothetical protein [Lentzea sp. BCCO 10_0798]
MLLGRWVAVVPSGGPGRCEAAVLSGVPDWQLMGSGRWTAVALGRPEERVAAVLPSGSGRWLVVLLVATAP